MNIKALYNVYLHNKPKNRGIFDEKRDTYFSASPVSLGCPLNGKNVSRFSSILNVKLCREVGEGYWSMFVRFAFLKLALVARKSRKTSEFSIQSRR